MYPFACRADDSSEPVAAPPNPEFTRYLIDAAKGRGFSNTSSGRPLGLIPSPVDLSHNRGKALTSLDSGGSLPASYDLRAQYPARLTAIRDQGNCGSCWAFATYGSLEGCLMPSQSFDFSEKNLKNNHGFDWTCCEGGTAFMSVAYLSRWSGPVLESSDPYTVDCAKVTGLSPAVHVQNIDFLPARSGPMDNDAIKQAVMATGPVYTELYWSDGYYQPSTHAYYCPVVYSTNHSVCIVGWDDNYPGSNFSTAPAGNGAFICRNSWGSGWGDGGYFYASYYDGRIGTQLTVFSGAEPADNFDRIYQYDPFGWVSSTGYSSTTAWMANIFTAAAAGYLKAAAFYTGSPNSTYEIRVYLDPVTGPINSTGPVLTQTGTLSAFGYHTVRFDSPVEVALGQRFSVVVKLNSPGYTTPIAFEYPMSQYSGLADSNYGESYISSNGVSWTDIRSRFDRANVCLKVFQDDCTLAVSPSTAFEVEGPAGGSFTPAGKTYIISNLGTSSADWTAGCTDDWLTVSPSTGTLNAGSSATVTVSLTSGALLRPAGRYTASVRFHLVGASGDDILRSAVLTVYRDYSIRPAPFGWLEPSPQTVLSLGDDAVSSALDIPFEFSFYEKPYTKLYVSSNGLLGFVSTGMSASLNSDLPGAATPNATICPYWDDLNPKNIGAISVGTCGISPNRKLVVSWVGVPIKANNSSRITFQAVLCEGSKDIIFQYKDVAASDTTYGSGRSATVGLENSAGSVATKYSYNGSTLLKAAIALRFTDRGEELMGVKKRANGYATPLSRQVVTGAFADYFYIGSDNGAGGLRVHCPGHALESGMRASINGQLDTAASGERQIEATYARPDGVGSLRPRFTTMAALGGANWGFGTGDESGQQGVYSGFGLNTIGQLVRLCGRVRNPREGYFYLDDSGAQSGLLMVKVECPGIGVPPTGSTVVVTGICSMEEVSGVKRRVLLLRSASDLSSY